jgi:transcriptional regulator with XRE-family HTH domain
VSTPTDGTPCPFGAKLRELRERAGLNKSALARASGIGRGPISRLERGLHPPDYDTLSRLAAALGLRVADFRCPGWEPPTPESQPRRWRK